MWDPEQQQLVIGRFGHKARVAALREQTADAFATDMGLSNKRLPAQDALLGFLQTL